MFWNNYVRLCAEIGKSPNGVAAELNVSSGSITGWKKGSVPRVALLQKIADYFGVSVASLLGEDETAVREEAEQNHEKILRLTESAEESLMQMFLLKMMDATEDQRDTMRNLFSLSDDEFRRAMDMFNIMYKK